MKKGIVGVSLFIFCFMVSFTVNAQNDREPGTDLSNSLDVKIEKKLKKALDAEQNGIATTVANIVQIKRANNKPTLTFTPFLNRSAIVDKIKGGEGIKYERPTRDGSKYNGN